MLRIPNTAWTETAQTFLWNPPNGDLLATTNGLKRAQIRQKHEIEFGGIKFWFEKVKGGLDKFTELGKKNNREVFDAVSIGPHIILRHWIPGDRFQPIGQTGKKKLQDLFVNQKIPLPERHRRVIGESDDGSLFWVNGLRIADPFKVKESTTELLLFHWEE